MWHGAVDGILMIRVPQMLSGFYLVCSAYLQPAIALAAT